MSTTGVDGYPVDKPDPTPRIIWLGARVISAAVLFFFFAFAFAYFYLKALNSQGLWNTGLEVSVAFASVILAAVLASAIAYGLAVHRLKAGDSTAWQGWAMITLLLGFVAIVMHVWQLDTLPFTPTDGGYPSVFVDWTVALIVVELGAMYWLLSVLRGALRVTRPADPGEEGPPPVATHLGASAQGFWFFWRVVVVVEIVAYVLLVLVR